MEFKQQYAAYQQAIEEYLNGIFTADKPYGRLQEAMRYSILGGGKRIRPVLTLEFARLGGIDWHLALPYACALELVHNYSLIHDDLPCMDDDDLRRGRPTNHRVYGEATAVLAGDGLLTLAFEILSREDTVELLGPARCIETIRVLSCAAAGHGTTGVDDVPLQSGDAKCALCLPVDGHARFQVLHQYRSAQQVFKDPTVPLRISNQLAGHA